MYYLENVVPIKAYDGRKSKNSTLMSLSHYLIKTFYGVKDVRKIIIKDFLRLSPYYVETND